MIVFILREESVSMSEKLKFWLKFLGGFCGWIAASLLVFSPISESYIGAFVYIASCLAPSLLGLLGFGLTKPTRPVSAGIASAMGLNLLVALILGTYLPPYLFVPVLHPQVYQFRHNFVYKPVDFYQPGVEYPCAGMSEPVRSSDLIRPQGRIVFVSYRDGNTEIYSMETDGSGVRNLTNNSASEGAPAWSPDGRLVAFVSDRDGNSNIYTMLASGEEPRPITDHPAGDYFPRWSPDGKKLAFVSNRSGNLDVFVMNRDGSEPTELTNDPGDDTAPAWSPDGSKLVFHSNRDGDSDIYLMNADGSGIIRLTDNAVRDFAPAWSPDGRQIAFSSLSDRDSDLYLVNADGSNLRRLTKASIDEENPIWSPDGSCIGFNSDTDLFAIGVDGSNQVRLAAKSKYLEWSPDGAQIVHGGGEIYRVSFNPFQRIQLTHKPAFARETDPDWRP